MPKHKSITAAAADRIRPPKEGQVDHFDGSYPGLTLRVAAGGRKALTFLYRFAGKQKRITFGLYPAMSLAVAHDKWREARDLLQAGRDPGATTKVGSTVFSDVAAEWLQRDQAGNRTQSIIEKALRREVLPIWGHRNIGDIGRRDVLDLIDGIADRGTTTMARRIFGHLHRLFRWAVGRGIIELSPMQNLPRPGSEVQRDRVLTDDELVRLWSVCDQMGDYGQAIRLLILTGARREEISKLRWSEIEGNTIRLEGGRTKTGEARIIPLSTAAMAIISSPLSPCQQVSDFVFDRGLLSWSRAKRDLDELVKIPEWRVHDLRRTTATGLQKLGTPLQVTESVLGHTSGSRAGIIGVYQRHDYAAEKRAALEAWGAHVMALVEGRAPGKVVAFGGR
jgi:integrase